MEFIRNKSYSYSYVSLKSYNTLKYTIIIRTRILQKVVLNLFEVIYWNELFINSPYENTNLPTGEKSYAREVCPNMFTVYSTIAKYVMLYENTYTN